MLFITIFNLLHEARDYSNYNPTVKYYDKLSYILTETHISIYKSSKNLEKSLIANPFWQ